MRLDKLTSKFQLAFSDAQSLALGNDNPTIEPVHLLLALLNQDDGAARPLLNKVDERCGCTETTSFHDSWI